MIYLLILLIIIALTTVFYTIKNGISPNISSRRCREAITELIDTEGTVIDCGSGWGTVLFHIARRLPQNRYIGIENSPVPYFVSQIIAVFTKSNIRFIRHNFFNSDLSEASVIICYLYPGGMTRFKNQIIPLLKPGTIIISNYFALPDLTPEKMIQLNDLYNSKIYRYRI